METILTITYLYLLVLLLALLVERIMEVIIVCWNYAEWKLNAHYFWDNRTRKLLRKFSAKAHAKLLAGTVSVLGLGRRIQHYTKSDEGVRPGNIIIFSSSAVRGAFIRTLAFVTTSCIGITLCLLSGINFVEMMRTSFVADGVAVAFLDAIGPNVQIVFSGIIIGLGAEPVHHIITRLEHRREMVAQRDRLNKALMDATEQKISRN